MKKSALNILLVILLMIPSAAQAYSTDQLYSLAKTAARAGRIDTAFMYDRIILTEHPQLYYRPEAVFANAEYLFWNNDYKDGSTLFKEYVSQNKNSKESLLALAYLLKIAQIKKDTKLALELEKQIKDFRSQLFIFKKVKEYKFKSPLLYQCKIVYSLNRIEFYVQEKLLVKI